MTTPITEQTSQAETAPLPIPAAHSGSHTASYLALFGGIVCIGFSAIFVRWANTTGDVAGFYRLFGAALVMTIPMLIRWRQGRARLSRRALLLGLLAGAFFATDMSIWATAVNLTTAANATLLGNTAPIWVGLGSSLLFGEKLGAGYWRGLAVAFTGAALIIGIDALLGLQINPGNLLPLISGAAYACYQMITQKARGEADVVTYSWLFSLTGGAILFGVSRVLGHPLTGYSTQQIAALIALALISHVGGWTLINYALGGLRASLVSVILLTQPILTALFAIPLLGEKPTLWHVIGGAITLAGIYMVHRSMSAEPPPTPPAT